jgi:hypothetical protein
MMGRKARPSQGKKPNADRAARYPVGYGKPPLASRFKPGTSGNTQRPAKGRQESENADQGSYDGKHLDSGR